MQRLVDVETDIDGGEADGTAMIESGQATVVYPI